jgi:hypothetical protein
VNDSGRVFARARHWDRGKGGQDPGAARSVGHGARGERGSRGEPG